MISNPYYRSLPFENLHLKQKIAEYELLLKNVARDIKMSGEISDDNKEKISELRLVKEMEQVHDTVIN
jgi:hypothetical protein